MTLVTVVIPEPFRSFSCNQQGCCCKGWRIPLNSSDLARLLRVHSQEEREQLLSQAEVSVDPERQIRSVFLATGPQGACRFLAHDGRCDLQLRHGVDALPLICQAFPVFSLQTRWAIELYYNSICPEVLNRIDAEDGPVRILTMEVDEGSDLNKRTRLNFKAPPIRLGDRLLSFDQLRPIRQHILDALSDRGMPALDCLARIHLAMGRLCSGAPIEAFGVESNASVTGFDRFFDDCVSSHYGRVLSRFWKGYRRFVFDSPLDQVDGAALQPFLEVDRRYRRDLDPRQDFLQPLLYRWLAVSFFSVFLREMETSEIVFNYGAITHKLAMAMRYALALSRWSERPVDRTMLKVAFGASEFLYRSSHIPIGAMSWFQGDTS